MIFFRNSVDRDRQYLAEDTWERGFNSSDPLPERLETTTNVPPTASPSLITLPQIAPSCFFMSSFVFLAGYDFYTYTITLGGDNTRISALAIFYIPTHLHWNFLRLNDRTRLVVICQLAACLLTYLFLLRSRAPKHLKRGTPDYEG